MEKGNSLKLFMINAPLKAAPIGDYFLHNYLKVIHDANVSTLPTALDYFKFCKKGYDFSPFEDLNYIWNTQGDYHFMPKKTFYILSNRITGLDIISMKWLNFDAGPVKKIITTEKNAAALRAEAATNGWLFKILENKKNGLEIIGLEGVEKVDYDAWRSRYAHLHESVYFEAGPKFFQSQHQKVTARIKDYYNNKIDNVGK